MCSSFYVIYAKDSLLVFLKVFAAGTIVAGGLFTLIYGLAFLVYKREAFGMGDVKLAFMLGAVFGLLDVIPLVLTSFIVGGIVAIAMIIINKLKDKGKEKIRKKEVPFAPFLVVASYITVFMYDLSMLLWGHYVDVLKTILKL